MKKSEQFRGGNKRFRAVKVLNIFTTNREEDSIDSYIYKIDGGVTIILNDPNNPICNSKHKICGDY